jgi:hypothetical protein
LAETTVHDAAARQPESAARQLLYRDGAGEAGRAQPALNPTYVAVDERSLAELLAFAREYAKELNFFGVDDDQLQVLGDWSGFVDDRLDLAEVVAFMQDPDQVATTGNRLYTRPHFVLWLTFLQLLRHTQQQLNTLTGRHLDFYYQQVLRLSRRPGTPDQVHILVDLAPDTPELLLPAGTLLNAGSDSLGQERFYRTDQDLVANHAQIARLSSLFVEQRVTGIRAAREEHQGTPAEAFLKALEMALGEPDPGDPLPRYPNGAGVGHVVDWTFLKQLYDFVTFVETGFYLSFDDFRRLLRLKRQRDGADEEWNRINAILEKAGKARTGDDTFRLNPTDPRDFDTNLEHALGDLTGVFNGIQLVETIYDAYHLRTQEGVRPIIENKLHLSLDDFTELMGIKVRIDSEWEAINRLLLQAGRRKGQLESLPGPIATTDFAGNLEAAVGPLSYPQVTGLTEVKDVDEFYARLLDIERFFFMSLEKFSALLAVATNSEASPQEWLRADAILADAYKAKVYASRRNDLKKTREKDGFAAMIESAVAGQRSEGGLSSLALLLETVNSADDEAFLRQVQQDAASVTDAEWERVYRIIEMAQRLREKLPEPVAQKVEWRNLHAASDATAVQVTAGVEADRQFPRWRTFGRAQTFAHTDSPPPPTFGWAVTSPLLALSEGKRTLTLTLGFPAVPFDAAAVRALFPGVPREAEQGAGPYRLDKDSGPFQIEISTGKGWITPDSVLVNVGNYVDLRNACKEQITLQALQFKLTFDASADALAPPPAAVGQIETPWPVLRLLVRQIWQPEGGDGSTGRYVTHYDALKTLVLQRTHLRVEVAGLTPLLMQNDETQLAPGKPFEPFGSRAVAGSRFYLGHPELVYKIPDHLDFRIDWMGVPEDLAQHYQNYSALEKAENLTARISVVDRRVDRTLSQAAPLFASMTAADQPHTITVSGFPAVVEPNVAAVTDTELLVWPRYLQWELNAPDFQVEAYPAVAAAKAIRFAAAVATGAAVATEAADAEGTADAKGGTVDAAEYQVNPPYIPKIKQVRLDYTAATEIDLEQYRPGVQLDRLFHIQPFGYNELRPATTPQPALLLPQFGYEGELYIGLQDVQPPQNLALLFQLAEGSGDPDVEPVPVQWSYLSDNRWVSLDDGNVLQDTTRGLINTGIIVFALEPARPSTLLPPPFYWLRAAIPQHSTSVGDTVAIHTQAVVATFVDQNNAPDHLSRPLPAGTITELAAPLPQIAGVRQPYTSYGGKMAEAEGTFYTRISERLRHKQRALTVWDYEQMILDRFPQLYKAKCLPADPQQPGRVEVVVIPDIRNKLPFNPFEPKAPADLIADIEQFLAAHAPAAATIKVKNAHYVPVKVRFAVRFLPGRNEGYYRQRLNQELNRFLSPWAYEEGADIVIGGRIYANVIINFIEQRPYVDYVAHIKLFSSEDGRTFQLAQSPPNEGYWVETPRPDGILVAARQHEIDLIGKTDYAEEDFTGINYMMIELDFVVG